MRYNWLGVTLIALTVGANFVRADHEIVTEKLNKKIDQIVFMDLNGKPAPIADIKDMKAIVVVFLSFDCPVSNSYPVILAEMHKQYADKGVAFVAVSTSDDVADIKKQAAEYKIPFPVYTDPKLTVSDGFKAVTTPEAFLLDHNLVLRYRGRIDNGWAARLKKNARTTEHDLKNALDDLLAGQAVKVPATRTVGCPVIAKSAITKATDSKITYTKHIQPILQNHCQECHRPNAVGPFALTNYKQALNWADDIKAYTQDKKMPPWKPTVGRAFHNDRQLSDESIKMIAAWVDAGCPEGDPKDAPKPKEFVEGWQLGKPDLILTVPEEFIVGPSGSDTFRCFVLPTNLDEDKYIIGFEVKPGNNRVVHHTLNFWDLSGQARKKEEAAKASARPTDQDRGPGYSASMGIGFAAGAGKFGGFGGWAPGQMPRWLPKGTGYLLPKGADVVIQTHYHRNGKEEKDKLQVGLYFSKEKIDKPYQALVVPGAFIGIPANESNYKVTGGAIVNSDCTVYSVMPHMHLLGKKVKVTMTPPEGKTETLVQIDDWDYNWQETYWFKTPIDVKAGTRFDVEAIFDNSDKNPNNPRNPPALVLFGEQTTNEMLFGFLGATGEKGVRLRATPTFLKREEKK